ncbi:MAG: pitrilysin family protein [Candidatus Omnitrophica bacterium]|nr:pitrilysin family protein [Candidatus Omnitrophota bacterium]MDD5500288.1 pitrilysin family protein [Candidatus Omnitrophota bacterium]
MYKKSGLDNGLRVVTSRLEGARSVSLGFWINIGSRYEAPGISGISHYLEHLLFKGSKKYSCSGIKESIEGVGGSLNGFTSEELTCYLVKIPARHLDKSLDILSDMVLAPRLNNSDVEKERTVILEELKMYRDLPQSYVYELLDGLLWPGQPLGSPVIGSVDSVSGITPGDLKSFCKRHYTPVNTVLSAAGSIEHDALVKKVSGIFSGCRTGSKNVFAGASCDQDKSRLCVLDKPTEQTHMAMGFHSLRRGDPLRHAQVLLNVILGANMSSRLFNEVREKRGLAYEIGSGMKRYYDTGVFLVHAGIDNRKVVPCIDLVLKELEKTKDRLVSEDEFRRAKEFYLGQLMLSLEDTMEYMLWMGEGVACLDRVNTFEEIAGEVSKVKREDLRCLARRIFKREKINLSLIGPLEKEKKRILSSLNLR